MSDIKKIAIIGCDSTHIDSFVPFLQSSDSAEIVSVFDDQVELANAAAQRLRLRTDLVANTINECFEKADYAFVVGRFADSHYIPAKNSIMKGLKTFVDKPFTANAADASSLCDLAQDKGVKLISCSPLRFCDEVIGLRQLVLNEQNNFRDLSVIAPLNCIDIGDDKRFDSALFYGIHGIDMLATLVGDSFEVSHICSDKSTVTVHLSTDYQFSTRLILIKDMLEKYVVAYATEDSIENVQIKLDGSYYDKMVEWLLEEPKDSIATSLLTTMQCSISCLTEIDEIRKGSVPR